MSVVAASSPSHSPTPSPISLSPASTPRGGRASPEDGVVVERAAAAVLSQACASWENDEAEELSGRASAAPSEDMVEVAAAASGVAVEVGVAKAAQPESTAAGSSPVEESTELPPAFSEVSVASSSSAAASSSSASTARELTGEQKTIAEKQGFAESILKNAGAGLEGLLNLRGKLRFFELRELGVSERSAQETVERLKTQLRPQLPKLMSGYLISVFSHENLFGLFCFFDSPEGAQSIQRLADAGSAAQVESLRRPEEVEQVLSSIWGQNFSGLLNSCGECMHSSTTDFIMLIEDAVALAVKAYSAPAEAAAAAAESKEDAP